MGIIYDVFDKFSIINIVIGLLLGIYLAMNNSDSNLWIHVIPFIIVFSIFMTFLPTFAALLAKIQKDTEFSIKSVIEAFFLNVAMVSVCTAFGLVFASLVLGSLIPSNSVIFK